MTEKVLTSPLLQTEKIYEQLHQSEEEALLTENPLLMSEPDSPTSSIDSTYSFLVSTRFKKTTIDFFEISAYIEIVLVLCMMVFVVLFAVFAVQMYRLNLDYDTSTYETPPSGALYLSLLGDSLINRPCKFFNLRGRLNSLVGMNMNIANFGHDGDTISEIAARLPTAIAGPPDALILFWDSDCSDINEYAMSPQRKELNRFYYQSNLTYVINTTLSAGVKFMAIAGPELLGEKPFLTPHAFWRKKGMLEDYREMNRNIAAQWNLPYIDVRHELIKTLPWFWGYTQWYTTVDGEHLNARGVRHVSEMFADALLQWMKEANITQSYSRVQSQPIEIS